MLPLTNEVFLYATATCHSILWETMPCCGKKVCTIFASIHLKLKEFLYLGHISGLRQAVNYYRGSERLLCKKVPLVK